MKWPVMQTFASARARRAPLTVRGAEMTRALLYLPTYITHPLHRYITRVSVYWSISAYVIVQIPNNTYTVHTYPKTYTNSPKFLRERYATLASAPATRTVIQCTNVRKKTYQILLLIPNTCYLFDVGNDCRLVLYGMA